MVTLVFLCLLLGAVTNVVVAWGVALKGGESPSEPFYQMVVDETTGRFWCLVGHQQRFGMEALSVRLEPTYTPTTSTVPPAEKQTTEPSDEDRSDEAEMIRSIWTDINTPQPLPRGEWHLWASHEFATEYQFGIPWRAMWCGGDAMTAEPAPFVRARWDAIAEKLGLVLPSGGVSPINHGGLSVSAFEFSGYGVPLGVLPIGFTLNTLFWGVVWAGVLAFVPGLKRRGRRRRGECVRCRYSRAGLAKSAACPECGA